MMKNKMKKLVKMLVKVILVCIVVFICFGLYTGLEITYYTYSDKKLPKEFDGYRIVFISDLHCEVIGKNQEKLIQAITSCDPDMVAFIGDMIDGQKKNLTPIEDLLSGLKGKYPMYAVSGNHEKDHTINFQRLLTYYKEYGVIDLDDQYQRISKDGANIGIYGLAYRDRYFINKHRYTPDKEENDFNILLYHDATVYNLISEYGYDLVLSGHTHGGIIRLPFFGGVINNNITLFPEFDKGMFHRNGSTLVVSSGIGDSYIPRFYNRSEVVCITLRSGDE